MSFNWTPIAKVYDPLKIGSIDGTDTTPHDRGITRALKAKYKPNQYVIGEPNHTIFVGRLSLKTTEDTLQKEFGRYGRIKRFRLVRDIVTGLSRKYAFIEYHNASGASRAYAEGHKRIVDDVTILVDYECERTLKGGGFGGKKESGQLRFGCRDRPFRKPFNVDLRDAKRIKSDYPGISKNSEAETSRRYFNQSRNPSHHRGKVNRSHQKRKSSRQKDAREPENERFSHRQRQ